MAQQRISFEWIVDEDPLAPWQAPPEEAADFSFIARESVWVSRWLYAFGLVLVALFTTAGAGLSHDEHARLTAEAGIDFALSQENLAWHTRDRGMFETQIDPYLSEDWRDEWRDIWRTGARGAAEYNVELLYVQPVGELIQANVLTHQPAVEWWQTTPYRETRFYRREGQNWLRSVPPIEYWGKQGYIETEHLNFHFYEKDAEAVRHAAPVLERAYVEMYDLLGMEMPDESQLLTIHVVPRPAGRWSAAANELDVTSPLMVQIPDGQTAGEFLAYDVMGWFTYRAMREATPGLASRYLYRWPILVWGLRGWLRDDLLDQPSPWRAEALRIFEEAAPTHLPLGLNNVTDLRGTGRPSREQVILRYLAAESFISFVVETYGREQLPELLHALVRYGSWDDIVSQLYGHSVEKFVADWNIYLLEDYPATLPQ